MIQTSSVFRGLMVVVTLLLLSSVGVQAAPHPTGGDVLITVEAGAYPPALHRVATRSSADAEALQTLLKALQQEVDASAQMHSPREDACIDEAVQEWIRCIGEAQNPTEGLLCLVSYKFAAMTCADCAAGLCN